MPNSILDAPLVPDEDEPMPSQSDPNFIDMLFAWMNEHNVHQTTPLTGDIIAHMRKLRAMSEHDDKPIKATDKIDTPIDVMKLVRKDGKPLITPPTTKMRR